jgi:hypothetical protein
MLHCTFVAKIKITGKKIFTLDKGQRNLYNTLFKKPEGSEIKFETEVVN